MSTNNLYCLHFLHDLLLARPRAGWFTVTAADVQTENTVSLQLFASGMMALSKVAGDGASLANGELYFLFGFLRF
jgi:hypothetical protein